MSVRKILGCGAVVTFQARNGPVRRPDILVFTRYLPPRGPHLDDERLDVAELGALEITSRASEKARQS